jgi:tRNA1Val (adenine37-N6)-methyltransferase
MKVSTEACILGAWFAGQQIETKNTLDLGSGTGLLMLMLAQRWQGYFHGIEIESKAAGQLRENIQQSKWVEKCTVIEGDVRNYSSPVAYDFIISNPPFYEKQVSSNDPSINLARHSSSLTLEELINAIDSNLNITGSFGILLPSKRALAFEKMAEAQSFCLIQKLEIRHSPVHGEFRTILHMGREKVDQPKSSLLLIRDLTGNYSDEFVQLMKAYYLNL